MRKNAIGDLTMILILMGMFFLIGGSVYGITNLLFGSSNDIRINEADSLYDKIVYGISDSGYLKSEALIDDQDLFNELGLVSESFDSGGHLYFKIQIFRDGKLFKEIRRGNNDLEVQCGLRGERLALCKSGSIKLNDPMTLEEYYINILTGSNQRGDR